MKKFLFDMVTDIRNNFDEKRVWGSVLMLAGIVYPFVYPTAPLAWAVAGGFVTFGLACLGIAAKADIKLGGITLPSEVQAIADKLLNKEDTHAAS